MNIFVVDLDPAAAAAALCDKHVVKMPLESAQVLSTVVRSYGYDIGYRSTHATHPCTLWTARSEGNFLWHCLHAFSLCEEYTLRYGRRHASQDIIEQCGDVSGSIAFGDSWLSEFVQALPTDLRSGDAVSSYRKYYLRDKARFARWDRGRPAPDWWSNEQSLPDHPALPVPPR